MNTKTNNKPSPFLNGVLAGAVLAMVGRKARRNLLARLQEIFDLLEEKVDTGKVTKVVKKVLSNDKKRFFVKSGRKLL